jgi:hypothetical protein
MLNNDQTLNNFQSLLWEETWDPVYDMTNVNKVFNNFQCILLKNFENSFHAIYIGNRPNDNWIMKGIKLSCKRKRELYILYRNTNNHQIKNYYKKYCAILKKVITEAKTIHFNNQIKTSSNEVSKAWKIITDSNGKSQLYDLVTKINSEAGLITDTTETAHISNILYTNSRELTQKMHQFT